MKFLGEKLYTKFSCKSVRQHALKPINVPTDRPSSKRTDKCFLNSEKVMLSRKLFGLKQLFFFNRESGTRTHTQRNWQQEGYEH